MLTHANNKINILQAPNGIPDPQIYGCLLAAYLLLNEMYVMCVLLVILLIYVFILTGIMLSYYGKDYQWKQNRCYNIKLLVLLTRDFCFLLCRIIMS